jgi:hypothetical protein
MPAARGTRSGASAVRFQRAESVLAELIANPRQHHGQRVRVVGFCHLAFEDNGLYIQGADFFQRVWKHGVWLDVEDSPEHRLLCDGYVLVEGTFNAERQGHLSMWSGELGDVTRMEAASAP